jgi:hypothetical protein
MANRRPSPAINSGPAVSTRGGGEKCTRISGSSFTTDEERAVIGISTLQADARAWDAFRRDQPRMTRDWFHDEVDLPPWNAVPAGYIRLCALFDRSAEEAERRRWPVVRLKGTHLHPTLEPQETAEAILKVCRSLA